MGLATSQVRLLALTSRKADIELQMQINSKRKMMLTRKATELSQEYYNRLKDTNIMYATSNGYEDVNYNYLMGESRNGVYTKDFVKDLMTNNDDSIPRKMESSMILTDQYGRVIANDEIARVVAKVKEGYKDDCTNMQTAQAICEFISVHRTDQAYKPIFNFMKDTTQLNDIDTTKREQLAKYMTIMIANGGYQNGGHVYLGSGSPGGGDAHYYSTIDAAKTGDKTQEVKLQEGYCYSVFDTSGSAVLDTSTGSEIYGAFWTGDSFVPINGSGSIGNGVWQALGNLVTYLAPIMSASIQNGTSTTVEEGNKSYKLQATAPPSGKTFVDSNGTSHTAENGTHVYYYNPSDNPPYHYYVYEGDETHGTWVEYIDTNSSKTQAENYDGTKNVRFDDVDSINIDDPTTLPLADGNWCHILNKDGSLSNYGYYMSGGKLHKFRLCTEGSSVGYYNGVDYKVTDNSIYQKASNVDNLQAGFKTGVFQLAMVSDWEKGAYHKNTTMNYFTHMNYVSDKEDTSKREEITAWFNAEQAAINEKETYWDTEIQNLSTELSAVDTEIESVKSLKNNSIKKVFDWGGS